MFDFSVLLEELETCINNKMYYSALMLALVIPDECGLVAYNIDKVGERYRKWVDEYATYDDYSYKLKYTSKPMFYGDLIYSLRNHIMHNGLPAVDCEENEVYHFIFNESCNLYNSRPEQSGITKININVPYLCSVLYEAGKEFYTKRKDEFPTGNDFRETIPDYMFVKKY